MWERVGRSTGAFYPGGVLLVEVTKQVYRPAGPGVADIVKKPLRVLEGLPVPGAKPV